VVNHDNGEQAVNAMAYRMMAHTNISFSNLGGSVEEVELFGHPIFRRCGGEAGEGERDVVGVGQCEVRGMLQFNTYSATYLYHLCFRYAIYLCHLCFQYAIYLYH